MSSRSDRSVAEVAGSPEGAWEVAIVGAGPAGSTLARELAMRGVRVLLVDRQRFPRPKVCGCCVAAEALEELRRGGLGDLVAEAGGVSLHSLEVAIRGRTRRLPLAGGRALSRRRLDAGLLQAARDAGAECCLGARAIPGPATGSARRLELEAGGDRAELRVPVVVAADGVGSPVLRRARELDGEPPPPDPAPPETVGLGAVLATTAGPEPGVVAMAVGAAGYVGLVRLEDGCLDVAAALRREHLAGAPPAELVISLLRQSGLAAALGTPDGESLRGADWAGTPALRRRRGELTARRMVAVGDAGGYWEPFTGEGIAWALAGAREAADTVARLAREWSPAAAAGWAREAGARRDRRQRQCRRVAALMARPRIASAVLRAVGRWPRLAAWALPGQRLLATPAPTWRSGHEGRA